MKESLSDDGDNEALIFDIDAIANTNDGIQLGEFVVSDDEQDATPQP